MNAGSFGIPVEAEREHMTNVRKVSSVLDSLCVQVGVAILSRVLLPSKQHLKQALTYMDMAIKVEMILIELLSSMFWSTVTELVTFTVALLLFLTDSEELGPIWWFSPHVLRALIGFTILRSLPRTHDIIKNANIHPTEKMSFEQIFESITRAAQEALDHFTALTRYSLLGYFGLTLLCFAIDLVSLLAAIKDFAGTQSPYADTTLLMVSLTLVIVDLYYIVWVSSLANRVPPYISAGFTQAVVGTLDFMYQRVGEKLDQQKEKRQRQLQQSRNELRIAERDEADDV